MLNFMSAVTATSPSTRVVVFVGDSLTAPHCGSSWSSYDSICIDAVPVCSALNSDRDSSLSEFSTSCCTTGPCGLASRMHSTNTGMQVRNYGVFGASVENFNTLYTGPSQASGLWGARNVDHQLNIYELLVLSSPHVTDYVIELGYNDALGNRLVNPPGDNGMARQETFRQNYRKILNDLQTASSGARLYCMNVLPNPTAPQVALVNSLISEVATEEACTLVDVSTLTGLSYTADSVHLSMDGEGLVSQTLTTTMTLPPPPPSPPPSTAGAVQDPHLRLAYGGLTDFRGLNDTFFSMLSVPGFDVAMKTTESTFMIKHNRHVNGSFITELAISALLKNKTFITIDVVSAYETGFSVSDAEGNMITRHAKWSSWQSDGIFVQQRWLTTSIKAHGWEVNATRKPVYNHITGPKWRFDFTMRPLTPEESWVCFPHGIIGQSFDGTGVGRIGKIDDYNQVVVKTTAMADGAIEGKAEDYVVTRSNLVKHKNSRFFKNAREKCEPRNVAGFAVVRLPSASQTVVAGSSDE